MVRLKMIFILASAVQRKLARNITGPPKRLLRI